MYLEKLNYEQRKIFLSLSKEVLTADDSKIDYLEESYLRHLCQEMSLSFNDEMSIDKRNLEEYFSKIIDKKIVIMELIALAYSNNEYHINQKVYIEEISNYLGFDKNILSEIEFLIEDFFKFQSKLNNFIGA